MTSRNTILSRGLVVGSAALIPLFVLACSNDNSTKSGGPDGSVGSTGGAAAAGGATGTGGGGATAAGGSAGAGGSDGGYSTGGASGEGGAGSLYMRLGGHAGIRSAVEHIVTDELKDTEIASFFVFQTGTTPPGHPTADQLEECLTNQLGKAAGGSETFPGALGADHGGFVCRDMVTIHAPFHISGAVFDKFVTIAASTLTGLKVPAADIATIGSVLNGQKPAIIDPDAPGGAFSGFADAGADGGAKKSLYERLGGHAGIRSALEAVVAAELKDSTIAPFFANQTAAKLPAGHPNADQVEECLTDQLGDAAGGPEVYPTTLEASHGGWQCRDMMTVHKSLQIDSADFDKFVSIAATTLTGLGVAPEDVGTIGAVLNGTKSEIVTK